MEKTKHEDELGLKNIKFWNINGLVEKSSNIIFKKKIQLFNIIFLSET